MSEPTGVNNDGAEGASSRRPSRRAIRQAERAAEREAYLTGQQPLLTRRELRRLREEAEALRVAVEAGEITAEQARELQNPLADPSDIDVPVPTTTGQHAAVRAVADHDEPGSPWTPSRETTTTEQPPSYSSTSWDSSAAPGQGYSSPSAATAAGPAYSAEPLPGAVDLPAHQGGPEEPAAGAQSQVPSWQPAPLQPLGDGADHQAQSGRPFEQSAPVQPFGQSGEAVQAYGLPEPAGQPEPNAGYSVPGAGSQEPVSGAVPVWQPAAAPQAAGADLEDAGYSRAQKEALAAAETGAFTPGDFAEAEGFSRPHSDPSDRGANGLPAAGIDPAVVPAQAPARRSVFSGRGAEAEGVAAADPAGPAQAWKEPVGIQAEVQAEEPADLASGPATPSRRPIVRIPSTAQGVRTVDSRTGELTSIQPVDPELAEQADTASGASSVGPVGLVDAVSPGASAQSPVLGHEAVGDDLAIEQAPRWPALHEESMETSDPGAQSSGAVTPYGVAAGAVQAGVVAPQEPAGDEQWHPHLEVPDSDFLEEDEEDSLTWGRILLIVFAVLVVAAIVIVGVWYLLGRGTSSAQGAVAQVAGHLLT